MSGDKSSGSSGDESSSSSDFPQVMAGAKYLHRFVDASEGENADGAVAKIQTPWLDENQALQTHLAENSWIRWDGVEGTAESHIEWMHQQAKSLLDDDAGGWRPYGTKKGVDYFIHDQKTLEGNGYGCFKLEGIVKVEPRDVVASMLDFSQIGASDPTVVLMKALASTRRPKGDDDFSQPFAAPVYWCNAPGFPFCYRDGLDLTGYTKDSDSGVVWQLSVSARGPGFCSMPGALAATDRYWAYKLTPNGDGTTTMKLLCQTELNGWIPRRLSNYFLCSVLIDYFDTMEQAVAEHKASGRHQKLLEHLGLEGL